MEKNIVVISDLAGRFDELMLLLKKVPEDTYILACGDLCDRHDQSKEIFEWFMANSHRAGSVLGNHDHFMTQCVRKETGHSKTSRYSDHIWSYNGGDATRKSFNNVFPEEVLAWIEALPQYREIDTPAGKILVSHAFLPEGRTPEQSLVEHVELDESIIWNRGCPTRRPEYLCQIAGHNSNFGLRYFSDEVGQFAICIDTSRSGVLTGIHLPSMKIYQQEYLD